MTVWHHKRDIDNNEGDDCWYVPRRNAYTQVKQAYLLNINGLARVSCEHSLDVEVRELDPMIPLGLNDDDARATN